MNDLGIKILSGGYYVCTPEWSLASITDQCYKLYFPIDGEASVVLNNNNYLLTPNNCYFINGYALQSQECKNSMRVYWIHFVPQSLYLHNILCHTETVLSWHDTHNEQLISYDKISHFFENPDENTNHSQNYIPLNTSIYIHSLILMFISKVIEYQESKHLKFNYHNYLKLKPAIDFMDENYTKSLKLEDIAKKVYLNPNYFLRLFKQNFNIAPYQYMMSKRLNEASKLLTQSNLSIREISEQLGYCNQFYFTRLFKSHFKKTPSDYRKHKILP